MSVFQLLYRDTDNTHRQTDSSKNNTLLPHFTDALGYINVCITVLS